MSLLDLPIDVLLLVLNFGLDISDLSALSQACSELYHLINEFGWSICQRNGHPSVSYSLTRSFANWSARERLKYDTLCSRAWSRPRFVARPLSVPWSGGKLHPALAINSSRLVVAAGNVLHPYAFDHASEGVTPPITKEAPYELHPSRSARRDITAISFLDDGGQDSALLVGLYDGSIEFVSLSPEEGSGTSRFHCLTQAVRAIHQGDVIECMTTEKNMLLTLSSSGLASLTEVSGPTTAINLQRKSWVCHLSMQSSSPFAVFGSSSTLPLTVHTISSDDLSRVPTAVLSTKAGVERPSAVYGISRAPAASPWGSSPQIIVSGWYDGLVRCYDLRASLRSSESASSSTLAPVLSVADPCQYEPVYSVSCGGGSSSYIAAGFARHSVVSFWDVRFPSKGWSVHAPGNDSSPVYSIIMETSRLFGATQSRPFVYDFGPEASNCTFPSLARTDGLRPRGAGFYVTKYSHNRTGAGPSA